jgi:hypothetical protein
MSLVANIGFIIGFLLFYSFFFETQYSILETGLVLALTIDGETN